MTIRAIIADDEQLSIDMLKVLLTETSSEAEGVDVIATCCNGKDALAKVAELTPDLLFLDINMPLLDGMSVAEALMNKDGLKPFVVFTTAHSEFAAQAFDIEALDYLMKPVQAARLVRTLEKIRQARQTQDISPKGKMIPVPMLGGIELIEIASIEWVEASRDYLSIQSDGRNLMIRKTIAAFAKETHPFLRQCHRSYLVNLAFVTKVIPKPKGEAILCLQSGRKIPVSRGHKDVLTDLM